TVWRPARVSPPDGTSLAAGTSLSVPGGVSAGTRYDGVSYTPAREPAVLRAAGRSYPDTVRERYLGVPDGSDTERVAAFTDDLTSDAETPYAIAVAVERWLEANREYSLAATHDPADGTVAAQFLFEMSTGYCEYFAATMTVMLRTQGVPARYVVGYSTGQQTAPGEYTVRAMNAHAWVEVYFPDVGWVRFDPTPGRSRLATEQRAFTDGTGGSAANYAPTETGSPGETFSPDRTATDGAAGTATAVEGGQSPPNGTTNGTGVGTGAAGGETTPKSPVSADGTTTEGDSGSVDGDTLATGTPPTGGDATTTDTRVQTGTPGTDTGRGETTADGTVTGDSPNTDDGAPTRTATDDQTADDGATDDQTTPSGEEAGTTTGDENSRSNAESGSDTTTTRPALRADLNRTAVPGTTVAVTVTRGGDPVSARVSFNGVSVGVTNDSGVV
ncbi:MAG: transglutaminase-like enzyme, putative cysteine protease, partial [halophilic archaeon J07HB67]